MVYRGVDNINNYKDILCNSSVAGDKKTPYNSIFLAVNPFDKARYKFHRRGLFECSSPRSRRAHEFRSLCEFVEALKKGCGYD